MSSKNPVFSMERGKIVTLLKDNPMTILELIKVSGIPRATLYHHLEFLKRRDLIKMTKDQEKTGQPVTISLTPKAQPLNMAIIKAYEILIGAFKEKK